MHSLHLLSEAFRLKKEGFFSAEWKLSEKISVPRPTAFSLLFSSFLPFCFSFIPFRNAKWPRKNVFFARKYPEKASKNLQNGQKNTKMPYILIFLPCKRFSSKLSFLFVLQRFTRNVASRGWRVAENLQTRWGITKPHKFRPKNASRRNFVSICLHLK